MLNNNSNYHLPSFETILLERQLNKRGGGILIYIKEKIAHNIRNDLCISDGDKVIVIIYRHQKHAMRIIYFLNRLSNTKSLFKNINFLNLYELDLYNTLCFTFCCMNNPILNVFQDIYPQSKE